MTIYKPFLKLKQNELQAISDLTPDVISTIAPFFDIPRVSKIQTEKMIIDRLQLGLSQLDKTAQKYDKLNFFIDNYDLDDNILLQQTHQYSYILDNFAHLNSIPVIALNRVQEHNATAISYAEKRSRSIGLRLQLDDMESFALAQPDLKSLWHSMQGIIENIHVFLDFRYIEDEKNSSSIANAFLKKFTKEFSFTTVSSTGSSIPANISNLIKTNKTLEFRRSEIGIWENIRSQSQLDHLNFGDYAVVSPDYSDAEIGAQLLRQVSTPKVFYPFGNSFFAARGVSFESSPLGNNQFFELADKIEQHQSYRQPPYSIGDDYIYRRSSKSPNKPLKGGTQGSWTKAMTSAHITFVSRWLRGLP